MKANTKNLNGRTAFTIIELLTVMSIIVILMSLLVPGLNQVKRYATGVKQRNQLHTIDTAIEMFNAEWGFYPPSEAKDVDDASYCGAMKLAEAMVGLDLMGVNRNTLFRQNGEDIDDNLLYFDTTLPTASLQKRRGPYLPLESTGVFPINQLYGAGMMSDFDPCSIVLCDVYGKVSNRLTGKRIGMPILYYKANTSKTEHNVTALPISIGGSEPNDIYDCYDNYDFTGLTPPFDISAVHPMYSAPLLFYQNTENKQIISTHRPYRVDSYILMSAGYDGLYGTDDDISNFGN